MKKVLLSVMILVIATNSFALLGQETWDDTILLVPCTVSGGVKGSVSLTGSAVTGISADFNGSATFAHYAGKIKSCPGYWGFCSGEGQTKFSSLTPVTPCH